MALESFVRQCFLLHTIYSDKLSRSDARGKDETLLFIPAAVEAICHVVLLDSCRCTRQSAGMLLYDLLQSRAPGRSSWAAVCLGESTYCYDFSDPLALTMPTGCTHTAAIMGARKSQSSTMKNFLKGTSNSPALAQGLQRLWRALLSSADIDQCLRSLLVTTWLFAFPRQAPRCLLTDPCYTSEELDYATLFDDSLPSDRLIIKDSFEAAQRVENYYRFGPHFKAPSHMAINLPKSSSSRAVCDDVKSPPDDSSSSLKISLTLSARKSSVNLQGAVSAAGGTIYSPHEVQAAPIKRNPSFKLVFK